MQGLSVVIVGGGAGLGELLATGSQGETILFADITPERVAQVRDTFRFLPDRR